MKAIIETGGKQYCVAVGDVVFIERLDAEENSEVVFDKVLMANGVVGNPLLKGVTVTGKVLKNGKDRKITVFKYTPNKKSTRKKQGHRQPYSKVEITAIM